MWKNKRQSRWVKPFLCELETLLTVIEDGARGDLDQLCRWSLYPKTWSVITEVLLTDLGLTCSSKSPRSEIAKPLWAIRSSGFLINELLFATARHSLNCSWLCHLCNLQSDLHLLFPKRMLTCGFWPSEMISLSSLWNEEGNASVRDI